MSAAHLPGPDKKTLVDVMRWRAESTPNKLQYRFLVDGETQEETRTNFQIDQKVRSIAARIQQVSKKGDRIMLLLPPSMQFIEAFFASLYAGCVAIPLYPHVRKKKDQILTRILNVAKDATPAAIISIGNIQQASMPFFQEVEHTRHIPWINLDEIPVSLADDWKEMNLAGDDLAFLQYTSGSTSVPKGVMVSHGNILHNTATIHLGFGTHPNDISMTWLPPYHDMGLIGGILTPLYTGIEANLMPPAYFLQRPFRWLKAISRLKANGSGGPNFAYDYAVKKVRPEQREELDLSSWTIAFCGAEPINTETLRKFAEYFEPCGFQYKSFLPCYGLAEGTLMVTTLHRHEDPVVESFDKEGLVKHQIIPTDDPKEGRKLMGCGKTYDDLQVRIVNPDTHELAKQGEIGEVWASGSSIAQGYWGRPDASKETFQAFIKDTGEGPFMRTGDLGFVYEGQLYITGRIKSLIIIDGSNHYPQDIEWTVANSHESIRAAGAAAYAIEVDGSEKLVITAELDPRAYRDLTDDDARKIRRAIKSSISAEHDLAVHDIMFTNRIPKTTSGKIKHHQCKADYLESIANKSDS